MILYPALITSELAKSNLMLKHLIKLEAASTYRFTTADRKVYFDGNYWLPRKIEFGAFNVALSGGIPSFPIKIPNINKWWSNLHLTENLRNKDFTIYQVLLDRNLKVIGYATEALLAADATIFKGPIDAPKNIDRRTAVFDVVSHRITERGEGPRRNHSPECQWLFKHTSSKVLGTDTNTYTCIIDHIGHAATKPITGANWADVWILAGTGGAAYVVGTRYEAGTCRYEGAETVCNRSIERCTELSNTINFCGDEYIPDVAAKKLIWMGREKSWQAKK